MLKFFRQYNKIILAVGAAFLMLAFLIQPTLSLFMHNPEDQPIGEVDGRRLTVADQRSAATELEVLQGLNQALAVLVGNLSEGDSLKWLLMKHDAQRLGLSASDAEVQNVLEIVNYDGASRQQLAARMGSVPPEYIRQAIRNWLTVEQYREIVLGQTHVSPMYRLQALDAFLDGQQRSEFELMLQGYEMLQTAEGHHRISEPLIQHMLRDLQTNVAGQIAIVEADRYLDAVEPPDQDEVQALFEQYRDVPRGQGEPYGFGYRVPARVKIEYLAVPVERAARQVQIDEVDALAYYEENLARFRDRDVADGDGADRAWTRQERAEVFRELREQEAEALAHRVAQAGQAMLVQHARSLGQSGAYRVVPEDYEPPSLAAIADRLEEQFGVRPEYYDDYADRWMPVANLTALSGIGRATYAGRADISFREYVSSARELEPGHDNQLVGLGLQTLMPSAPLEGQDGSRYLFRLVEAQASHAPESLEQVADQVRQDAHLRKAYEEALLPRQEEWLSRARSQGFEALVEAEGLDASTLPPIPRRQRDAQGQLAVPDVPGVGQSESFVEAIFEVADQVSDGGQVPASEVDEADRVGIAEAEGRLSLALFRVDQYQPVTEQQYREILREPRVASLVGQLALAAEDDPLASLSMEAVQKRVNFEPAEAEPVPADDTAPREPQRRPGQL